MSKMVFESDLSVSGINDLIKSLERYKKETLQRKIDLFTKILAEEGVQIAQMKIAEFDAIFSGELIASIDTAFGGSGNGTCIFYVKADSEHAAFVEFGTGYKGEGKPYPYSLPSGLDSQWKYVVGKQILANLRRNVYGWFYKGDDGNVYFTEGMESRPFMYETYAELYKKVERIAKEVFL